jgi:hypothetical protein
MGLSIAWLERNRRSKVDAVVAAGKAVSVQKVSALSVRNRPQSPV